MGWVSDGCLTPGNLRNSTITGIDVVANANMEWIDGVRWVSDTHLTPTYGREKSKSNFAGWTLTVIVSCRTWPDSLVTVTSRVPTGTAYSVSGVSPTR